MTACSTSDVADGWRDRRRDGGVVVDVRAGRVVASGLSMPHSPRLYRGTLYLHNSGAGDFGAVDPATGRFDPVCFCPGYLRGLAFTADYAVVGLSKPRRDKTFTGLALDDRLAAKGADARSGLQVIDLRTGDVAHWLRVEGMVTELYDVVVLPGVARPTVFGFKSDDIVRTLTLDDPVPLSRPPPLLHTIQGDRQLARKPPKFAQKRGCEFYRCPAGSMGGGRIELFGPQCVL